MSYTQSDRERATQLILAEIRKGYTIDEAVKRLTSNDSERDSERCPDCGRTSEEGACFYCKMD